MKSKIHDAIVTQAKLDYEGSITIDKELMDRANIIEGEMVQIVNLDNGERLETYAIVGEKGSGVIGMNGPAALRCKEGHKVHIISYAMLDDREKIDEKVIVLDENNKVRREFPEKDENKEYGD
jgi:aspartate 1-decarboxylase